MSHIDSEELLFKLQSAAERAQGFGAHHVQKLESAPTALEFLRLVHASRPALISSMNS